MKIKSTNFLNICFFNIYIYLTYKYFIRRNITIFIKGPSFVLLVKVENPSKLVKLFYYNSKMLKHGKSKIGPYVLSYCVSFFISSSSLLFKKVIVSYLRIE